MVNIIGPPGSGKSSISLNYAAEVISRRQPVVFVALDQPPQQIISRIKKSGQIDNETIDRYLIILDGYSKAVGLKPDSRYSFNGGNLSDFNIALSELLTNKPEIVIIDPISSLFIQNDEASMIRAVQIITAKIRAGATHGFISYEEGVHSETVYNTIRFLSDINLVVKRDVTESGEVMRAIRIDSSRGVALDETWHQFLVDPCGKIIWACNSIYKPSLEQTQVIPLPKTNETHNTYNFKANT